MRYNIKLLLSISFIISTPLFALDSSSFTNVTTVQPKGECYLTGDPKPVNFDSSQTTITCAQKFTDGDYVVVGISSDSGTTKTMYCQKLDCGYTGGSKVDFYDLNS